MARVTWLGEDSLHGGAAGPSFTTWQTIKFSKGEAVEVNDARIIAKAKNNQFFNVEDGEPKRGPGRPPKVKIDGDENPE